MVDFTTVACSCPLIADTVAGVRPVLGPDAQHLYASFGLQKIHLA